MSLQKYLERAKVKAGLADEDPRDNKMRRAAELAGLGAGGSFIEDLPNLQGAGMRGAAKAGGKALAYGAATGGAQLLGDSILGVPEDHGFIDEFKRGALGGGIVGAAAGPHLLGKYVKMKGLKGKALAAAMGALTGAGGVGLKTALSNFYDPSRD